MGSLGGIDSGDVGSEYSELLGSIQEFDEALSNYGSALKSYEDTLLFFKHGNASSSEVEEATRQLAYANEMMVDAHIELEESINSVESELYANGESQIVSIATEHSLTGEKIDETTEKFSSNGDDFLQSIENISQIGDQTEKTFEILERDNEFLKERIGYSLDQALDEAGDIEIEEIKDEMESFGLRHKRNDIIRDNPKDSYIGGVKSETGTKDLESKREELLGPPSQMISKRDEIIDLAEDELEEKIEEVQERNPRYIH